MYGRNRTQLILQINKYMIKTNELRVGNKIQDTEGVILTVQRTIINDSDILVVERPSLLTINYTALGIPLTAEWLKRLGFYSHNIPDFKVVMGLIEYSRNGLGTTSIDAGYGRFRWHEGYAIDNIMFVHQLQNLYLILTGEELILKNNEPIS